jgi:hypothetical protein
MIQSMTPTTGIQVELPRELATLARSFVQDGWAPDFDGLLTEALRRYLESHSTVLTESMVMNDVEWGLHGED